MSFETHIREDRRLVILRLLSEAAGRSANASMIDAALDTFGHRVSRDVIEGDLAWLDEAGLLRLEAVGSVKVATLTGRGQDVAEGTASHPGVKRPRAGE